VLCVRLAARVDGGAVVEHVVDRLLEVVHRCGGSTVRSRFGCVIRST
jgi:hypothetical protein